MWNGLPTDIDCATAKPQVYQSLKDVFNKATCPLGKLFAHNDETREQT